VKPIGYLLRMLWLAEGHGRAVCIAVDIMMLRS
jgi:hypothetical protein